VDDVLFIYALLTPTFDPGRPDRRKEWWMLEPQAARGWLCKRLRARKFEAERDEETRLERQIFYTESKDPDDPFNKYKDIAKHARIDSAEGRYFEDESADFLLQELAAILSERQLEVIAQFLQEQAHEQRTYEQIGRELGMAPGTVKSHVFRVRNNPGVSEILRPDGSRSRNRPRRR
jgi:DNA-directed RNA polymerase specialized sigma24 family protein